MKTIKILLISFLAILLMSFQCEADEATGEICNCYKLTYVRYQQNEWYHNGSKIWYSDDCTDDGDIVGGYSGQGYTYQYRVECE